MRYELVRELVKNPELRIKDIAEQTGYNKGHVSRLRKEAMRQALETEQKTAVSPGKGTGFNYARALGITVLQPALETKQKTAVSPDGGKGFIDGAWQCQCGKAYEVTCISSKPPKREWVGLTDEERRSIREWRRIQKELGPVWAPMLLYLYEAIEAKLKEKNT